MSIGTLRVAAMLLVSLLNLVFAYLGYLKVSKYSLIFLPPLIFILFPIFIGYIEEEGYTNNPYLLVAVSVISRLLPSSENEKFIFWVSIAHCFVLIFVNMSIYHLGKVNFRFEDRLIEKTISLIFRTGN